MITVASGSVRQTCTAITDAMASVGLPSQWSVAGSSRPTWRRMQSMGCRRVEHPEPGEHAECDGRGPGQQHQEAHQPLALEVGRSRTIARIFPSTSTRIMEMTVKRTCCAALAEDRVARAARKFRSPTKSKLGSPTVTSLRLKPMASTNGTATRARM